MQKDFTKTLKDTQILNTISFVLINKISVMQSYNLTELIDKLEKQIQFLYNDYKALLNRHNTLNELNELRLQIKQAEETLSLQKRIQHFTDK